MSGDLIVMGSWASALYVNERSWREEVMQDRILILELLVLTPLLRMLLVGLIILVLSLLLDNYLQWDLINVVN